MLKLHHITAYARSPKRSKKFYSELGLRLLRITVNQHDPFTLQADFGSRNGPHLSLLFYPRCQRGKVGLGGVNRLTLSTPGGSRQGLRKDPDGLEWEVFSNQDLKEPRISGLTCLRSEPLVLEQQAVPLMLERPGDGELTTLGYGVVHHAGFTTDRPSSRYHYDSFDQLWELVPSDRKPLPAHPDSLSLPEFFEPRRAELEKRHGEHILDLKGTSQS